MDKNQAKLIIQKLVNKYEDVLKSGTKNKYTEEETKKDFIVPLFIALGWDMEDRNEVTAEEHISGDRVDYGFYINSRPKFYLEAKPFKVDLNDAKYARQAIKYSWNKGVTWAVLTDFESIKVFNANFQAEELAHSKFFEISYDKYIEDFDRLWLLSKESFENGEIDKKAEEWGKSLKRVSVTDALYKDLTECRKLLTDSLKRWNENVPEDLLDEGVQKLLNRLVFIRVLEDRNIEPHILKTIVREWEVGNYEKDRPPLYLSLVKKFRELDTQYNSNLFDKHTFETWEEHDNYTKKVIDILYGKSGYYEYDFKIMPADILGAVYENYLGYKLEQLKRGSKIGQDSKKRKEHGIYYTPEFIVDYIIKNALRPVLEQCGTIDDLMKIKILDPACGSGSFLIKAVDAVYQRYYELGERNSRTYKKLQIITQNIYGVDLDQQAVEIARLNLLINAVEEKVLLPSLAKNIKNGNSLISGTDEELEKYFGKNWQDKKPFNWEQEFPEVFKQGGFNVIVGNPPWGANIDKDAEYLAAKFPESTKAYKDIYKIFIDLALQKLKILGWLGFVVPNTFLYQPRYQDIKDLLNNYKYLAVNLGEKIFAGVELPCCVLITEKEKSDEHIVIDLTKIPREDLPRAITNVTPESAEEISATTTSIIKNTGLTFNEVFLMKDGGVKHQRTNIGKADKGKSDLRERIYYVGKPKNDKDHPLLIGSDINRYVVYGDPTFILLSNYKDLLKSGEIVYFDKGLMETKEKIVWRQTADKIRAVIIQQE